MTDNDDEPRFYGIYRGTVHAVDGVKLEIIVPTVGGKDEALDWALPCWPPGWPQGLLQPHVETDGTHSHSTIKPVPSRGDNVWVMFEAGNFRKPVWMGTWR